MTFLAHALAALLAWLPHTHRHVAHTQASVFGPFATDPRAGKTFACWRLRFGAKIRALVDAGMIFADRTSKCGTIARICSERSGRCADAVRWDAGPWGRTAGGYRYGLDLWHVLAARVRHDGHFVSLTLEAP